jgi:serine/threonine protein kinase
LRHQANLNEDSLTKLWREVNIMKRLDHPNIVKLIEVIDTETTMYLILEMAVGDDHFLTASSLPSGCVLAANSPRSLNAG